MRRNVLSLALVAIVSLSGCIEYKEKVSLNKDGSGTVNIHFALSAEYLKQMNELMKMTAKFSGEEAGEIEQPTMIASENAIEEFLASSKSNVKLLEYNSPDSGVGGAVDAKFSFSSLAELDIAAASLFPDDNPSEGMEETPEGIEETSASYVKQDDGTWLFSRAMQNDGGGAGRMTGGMDDGEESTGDEIGYEGQFDGDEGAEDGDDDDGNMNLTAENFAGTDLEAMAREMERAATDTENPAIVFAITFPGKVLESNATSIDGSTATWSFTLQQISESLLTMTARVAD